jgi:tetratricopeptide (TPR) repeat protein
MKTKILSVLIALISITAFAQKKEIRNAEDAVEEGDYAKAKSLLSSVESQVAGENDNTKEDFYTTKAQAYIGAENGAKASLEDLVVAAESYQKLIEMGETETGEKGLLVVRNAMVNSAIADQKAEKYSSAAEKLYKSYELGKQDTIYLYYAANIAVTGKDFDTAADYFTQLLEMGYDGAETQYIATDKATGKTRVFNSEQERDLFVKSGDYIKPETKQTESKTGDIAKTLAQIYIKQDKPELAMKALEKAKAANPGDIALMQAEANVYYQMGKIDKYNEIMREVVKQDPENADLYYNLAVTSAELGDTESAIEFYKKAIEHDPEMVNAYLNLAVTILKDEKEIVSKMNQKLEEGDNAAYDALQAQRKELYNQALPYLKEALRIKPNSIEVVRTMMNIYYVLGETAKAEEMQA